MGLLLGHMRLLVLVFWMTFSYFFGYPTDSGESLVAGTLRMRYSHVSFAAKKPTWRLPPDGRVAALVTSQAGSVGLADVHAAGVGVSADISRIVQAGGDWKRIRLTKKTPVFTILPLGSLEQPIPKRWKRLLSHGDLSGDVDAKRRRLASGLGERHGIVFFWGGGGGGLAARSHASRFVHVEFNACRVKGSGVTCVDKHTSS